MKKKYNSIKDFFNEPTPKHISDQVDKKIKFLNSVAAKYPMLNNKEFTILLHYYQASAKDHGLTGNKAISFNTYRSRFFKGKMKAGVIYTELVKLNYQPKIVV